MASPVIESAAYWSSVAFVQSHYPTMPTDIEAGDFLVCLCLTLGSTTPSASDWDRLDTVNLGGSPQATLFTRRAGGEDTINIVGSYHVNTHIFRISGADFINWGKVSGSSISNPDPPTVTLSIASVDYLAIAWATTRSDGTITAGPSGYGGFTVRNSNAGTNGSAYLASTGNTINPGVFTSPGSGYKSAWTIVVYPETTIDTRAGIPGPLGNPSVVGSVISPVDARASLEGPLGAAVAILGSVIAPVDAQWSIPGPLGRMRILSWLPAVHARHSAPSFPLIQQRARHATPWSIMVSRAARHATPWSIMVSRSAHHTSLSSELSTTAGRHRSDWAIFAPVSARHAALSVLSATTPWAVRHVAGWSAIDAAVQILVQPNHLIHDGRTYAIGDDTQISADEGSPVWIASIDMLDGADYARIQVGDLLTLVLWGQPIALVCDGRRLARNDSTPRYWVSAISPSALLAAPWADVVAVSTVDMAHATVERLLNQEVDWQLVDWRLPESAAILEGAPFDLARQIVGAVKGVIESAPDGSLIARPLHPVSILEYAAATPAITLTDRDLLAHADHANVSPIINRLVVTSESAGSTTNTPQMEVIADDDDPHSYTVRAYPWPWSVVDLVHTGDSATQISDGASVWVARDELIEILAGAANAAYPVGQIDGTDYQYTNLGRVSVDGREITTATPEYSLLNLKYQAHAWEWRVTNARNETIQFLALQ